MRDFWKEAFLAVFIGASQMFSRDPSISLFYTVQAYTLLLIWIWLKIDPHILPTSDDLLWNLTATALVSVPIIVRQFASGYFQGRWNTVYGLMPFNAIFNAAWIACIASMLICRLSERKTALPFAWAGWGALFALAGVSLLLPARSSLLALAVGFLFGVRRHLSARRAGMAVLLACIMFAFIPKRVVADRLRFNEGNYRIQLWTVAVQAMIDHPWVGCGLGNFETMYQRYAFPVETDPIRFARTTMFAHNEFLQVGSDIGIPALAMLGLAFVNLIRAARRKPLKDSRCAEGGLLVIVILASYNIVWHLPLLVFLTLLLARLALGPDRQSENTGHSQGASAIGFLLLAGLSMSIGWCALRDHWAAEGRCDLILRVNSKDASAWKALADGSAEDSRSMLAYYANAAAYAPDNIYFHESFGRALESSRQKENYLAAIREYKTVLALAPNRALDSLSVGRVRYLLGEVEEASRWFKAALRVEPHYWEADLWIARCLSRLGRPAKAAAVLRHLQERRADYEIWRQKVFDDLPRPNAPSAYDQALLMYDPEVVKQELLRLRR